MAAEFFSRYEFLIYLLAAIFIASLYFMIKKIRLNNLIRQNGLNAADLKRFRFGAETSMAISDTGLFFAINFKLGTFIIDIKEIAEFEFLVTKFNISNAKASKNDGILFSGMADRIKPVLQEEKIKEIVFIIRLKNNQLFGLYLLKSSRAKKLSEFRQNNIVLLFETLEAVERKIKGKEKTA